MADNGRVHIFDETDPLREVVMFEPGLEAYVGTLLPQEQSLFFSSFDVKKGREEFHAFKAQLEQFGVTAHNGRDIVAGHLPPGTHCSEQKLRGHIAGFYPAADPAVVDELLSADTMRYGIDATCALNYWLTFAHSPVRALPADTPLCNVYFMRDPMNVMGGTLFLGKMKFPTRQDEVHVAEYVLKQLGISGTSLGRGTFEGGDGVLWNGAAWIGTGMRTDADAVAALMPQLPAHYEKFVVKAPPEGTFNGDMNIMHFDTYTMPIDGKAVVTCPDVAGRARVLSYHKKGMYDRGTLLHVLEERGAHIIPIPKPEQEKAAANMLVLKPNEVVVPLSINGRTIEGLKAYGTALHYAELRELTQGWGGAHCMVGQLYRGK